MLPFEGPLPRPNLPTYPQLLQMLRVTAATVPGPSGVAQYAGSSVLGPTLYVAFTQQLRTDSLLPRDREPCLVDDVRGAGLTPGFYHGRLAGSHNSLPVYEAIGAAIEDSATTTLAVLERVCPTTQNIAIPLFNASQETPTSLNVLVGNGSAFVSRPMADVLDDLGGITGSFGDI